MSVQDKHNNFMKCVQTHLEIGQKMEKLNISGLRENIEDISLTQEMITNRTCMQESLLKNKNQICKDKSISLRKNIPIMKLSQILDRDLTSNEKASEKYWNNYSKKISKKLWLPPQIDFQGLEQTTSLPGYLSNLGPNLQFSITENVRVLKKNSQKTLWKLLPSSQPDIMGEENIKTRKIRIYPNKEQRELLKKCFNAHRYFYNKAVEVMKEEKIYNFINLRNKVVINNKSLDESNKWMADIPYDTRQLAVKALITSFKSAKTNKNRGNITNFTMNFISKKNSTDICYINKKAFKNGKIFVRKLKKKSSLKCRKKSKKYLSLSEGDFPLIKDNAGRYYLCLLSKVKPKKYTPDNTICALDPGVRSFQTLYSNDCVAELGYNTRDKLYKLHKRIDYLTSLKVKSKTKYSLKRRCSKLRAKIKNITRDMHWKSCDFLTKNFQVILLPIFKTKDMSGKTNRKINKKTTRDMLTLSHYSFQQKLIYKANERGKTVILCKEHYTTKTCGVCGTLNNEIGSKKIFHCTKCNLKIDRDHNAARNILIRGLTLNFMDKMPSIKKE